MLNQSFPWLVIVLLSLILHSVDPSSIDTDYSDREGLECNLGPGLLAGCYCNELPKGMNRHVSCEKQNLRTIPANISNLLDLKITDDDIPILSDFVLYPDLEALHLDRNHIRYIMDLTFQQLGSLKTLSLSENEISSLHQKTFEGLVSLELLVLTGNKIYEVRANVFHGRVLPALMILKLDRCSLFSIEPNSFSGLSQLTSLHLEVNNIEFLPVIGDKSVQYNLTFINASDNRLSQVRSSSFVNLASLTHLYLDRNVLTELSNDSFPDSLTCLTLRGNRISSIGVDSLYQLRKLSDLDLSYNSLSVLNSSEPPWDVLGKILVHHNPWDCSDCSNSWLIDESVVRSWNSESNVTCATPSNLSGRNVYGEVLNEPIFAKCNIIESSFSDHSVSIAVLIGLAVSVVFLAALVFLVMKRRSRKFQGKSNGEMTSLSYSKMQPPFAIADEDDELEPL